MHCNVTYFYHYGIPLAVKQCIVCISAVDWSNPKDLKCKEFLTLFFYFFNHRLIFWHILQMSLSLKNKFLE